MEKILAIAYLILSLVGCDVGGRSTTTESTADDGKTVYSSKTRAWSDHASFECRESSSGFCHFVVFTSNCPGADCKTRLVSTFSLTPGEKREIAALPEGFRYCLNHFKPPVAPNCRKTG